ncbi:MAG: hypothetical protein ACR2G3_04840 [Solirubrobacterales bacterium]
MILPAEVRCSECGHEHTVYVLHSHNNFGDDEDAFVYRGYARCPFCGHKAPKEGAIEWLSDDPEERFLQLHPNFEPAPLRDQQPGSTRVTFGKWISPKSK